MQVFVFHGTGSRFANAVFSTQASAETWIARHQLTGLLTEYEMDSPAFDRRMKDGNLPGHIRKAIARGDGTTVFAQQYTDGAKHYHYYYGLGADSPGYYDAEERWHRDNDKE